MKTKILKKLCALSLSALMLTGAGIAEAVPVISAGLPVYAAETTPAGDFNYETNDDGTIAITGYNGAQTDIVIPNTINGKPVTKIAPAAFYGCTSLKSIKLPSSLKVIGGDYGHWNQYGWADGAFAGCSSLENIEIPNGVTEIGLAAFMGCSSLKSVVIPNSVTSLDNFAFYQCRSLENVTLSENITKLGYGVFAFTNIKTIFIPKSVTEISRGIGDYPGAFNTSSITIYGEKGSYAEKYAKEYGITFRQKNAPLTNNSSVSANTVTLGKNITVSCKASGGKGDYQYAVYYKKSSSSKWLRLSDFSSKTSVTFTPKSAVKYNLKVKAKDKSGKIVSKLFTVSAVKALVNKSVLSSSSVAAGSRVKIICKAEGGKGGYKYAVYYKKRTSTKWLSLSSFTNNTAAYFTPATAADYDIMIKVKDSGGAIVKKILPLTAIKPLSNKSTLSTSSVEAGNAVEINCKANGGKKTYKYAVYIKTPKAKAFKLLSNYSTKSAVTYTPEAEGRYEFKTKIKDSTGKVVSKILSLEVTKAVHRTGSDMYIYFDNSETQWESVYAYWWNSDYERTFDFENNDYGWYQEVYGDGSTYGRPVDYPGTAMTQIPGTDIWQARVPFGAEMITFNSGKTDAQMRNGEIGYMTSDILFDAKTNAGQVYVVDTSNGPVRGYGLDSTKFRYKQGEWKNYEGKFIAEKYPLSE